MLLEEVKIDTSALGGNSTTYISFFNVYTFSLWWRAEMFLKAFSLLTPAVDKQEQSRLPITSLLLFAKTETGNKLNDKLYN